MSILSYLQLQPVEPSDDGTISDLDAFQSDETIDLNEDFDEQAFDQAWEKMSGELRDDPKKINFSKE